jgi:hypothetical protein
MHLPFSWKWPFDRGLTETAAIDLACFPTSHFLPRSKETKAGSCAYVFLLSGMGFPSVKLGAHPRIYIHYVQHADESTI